MDLLLHSQTKSALDFFIANPAQGLLITGEDGSGKGSLASYIVEALVTGKQSQYIKLIGQDNLVIPIEAIREIIQFTKLTVPGVGVFRRAIIVEHAHNLTIEAQNALLKLLEEPPANTLIILTVNRATELLPTISSRLQSIAVLPIALNSAIKYFKDEFPVNEITPNFHISGGNVGLLSVLLNQKSEHTLVDHISLAKQILSSSMFEKLAMVDYLSKQKEDIDFILLSLMRVSRAALQQAITTSNTKNIIRWNNSLRHIIKARDMVKSRPNSKLLLTELMLHL